MPNFENIDKWMKEACPGCVLQVRCHIRPIDKVRLFSAKLIHIGIEYSGTEKASGGGVSLEGALQSLELDFRTKFIRNSIHGG